MGLFDAFGKGLRGARLQGMLDVWEKRLQSLPAISDNAAERDHLTRQISTTREEMTEIVKRKEKGLSILD